MTVYVIYITFIVFVILLILVGIYFLTLLRYEKVQNKKIEKIVVKLKDIMEKHLNYEDLNDIPKEEIKYLQKITSNKVGLQGFLICYKNCLDKNEDYERIREYANKILSYKTLLNNRIVRNKYRQSYILYLLAEFGINTEEVKEFAINSLNKKPIYVRNNALRLIQNSSNVPLVLQTLDVIDNSEYYFNDKILVDFLDGFMGDKELLKQQLLSNIDRYSNRLKKIIIEYFSNNDIDDEEVKLKVLYYLVNSKDKELLIASTKYFEKVFDDMALIYIIKNLNSPDWELRAVSASILGKYKNEDVKHALFEALKDENYFVRFNSVFSYIDMENEEVLKDLIDKIEDDCAREMLIYAMQSKNIISYEEYKTMLRPLDTDYNVMLKPSEGELVNSDN